MSQRIANFIAIFVGGPIDGYERFLADIREPAGETIQIDANEALDFIGPCRYVRVGFTDVMVPLNSDELPQNDGSKWFNGLQVKE